MIRMVFSVANVVLDISYMMFIFALVNQSASTTNFSAAVDYHYLPGVDDRVYAEPGDINIGAISVVLRDSKNPGESCSNEGYQHTRTADYTESIAFAVKLVNSKPDLLPNVTLGFIQRGICKKSPNTALATSLAFLPRSERVCNGSRCCTQQMFSSDRRTLSHDVIGVVTPGFGQLTRRISSLYSVANIPMVGAMETINELSDDSKHPFFFRIVRPAALIVKAMLRLIKQNNWSYISVVYQQDNSYGRSNYRYLKRQAGKYGICIATRRMLRITSTERDYSGIVDELMKFPKARVVVLFIGSSKFRKILKAIKRKGMTGHFIFVAGPTLSDYSGYYHSVQSDDPGIGTLVFDLSFRYVKEYYHYFSQLRNATSKNPWLKDAFRYILNCTNVKWQCFPEEKMFESYDYVTGKAPNLRIDAVLAFAHAAHRLLKENCPFAQGDKARACINGKLMRKYLKNVSYKGVNGPVKFEGNQNVQARIGIRQFVYDYYNYPFTKRTKWKRITTKLVVEIDKSGSLRRVQNISWDHLKKLNRIIPWTVNDMLPRETPESVCSRPCVDGEYKMLHDNFSCCWNCLTCRKNERLVYRNTSTHCEPCPLFMWPDVTSGFKECRDIIPTYLKSSDMLALILISLASIFLVLTISTAICYAICRNERVIKASSRELSAIQLFAICGGYCTIIIFQAHPTDLSCKINFYLFCISFALLYCPMLVKTLRIIRIFRSSIMNKQPRFISPQSQIIFTCILITIQVTICIVSSMLHQPSARRYQTNWTESKVVEISCDLTTSGIVSFLCFNFLLAILCCILAFMVRNVPDNFNESKFIFLCVFTTLLIWISFVPAYFTADRIFIRVYLLSVALLLNHTVALFLLFVPKVYAAIFVAPVVPRSVTRVT